MTEHLAATHTRAGVLEASLTPAMTALNALAGAVLLLDPQTRSLSVAALRGAQTHTVWQDGPLAPGTPAEDALTSGQPLYFEHAGALNAAYPQLEVLTGGVTGIATAVLPLRLDGQPLGLLVLDFKEPHTFTQEERRFLAILAAQTSVALDRVQLIAALRGQVDHRTTKLAQQTTVLETEQAAMQAFVEFTEAASHIEDVAALARLALDTLQRVLPGSSSVFYTRAPASWRPLGWTSELTPELLAVLQQGLPLDTPIFAELLQTRAPVFIDGWTAEEQQVRHTDYFQTVAVYPVEQGGEVQGVLSVALQHSPHWTAAQQALVRAVGRSFSLLYDRIAAAEQLLQQRAGAQGRGRILEVLAELTAEMTSRTGDFEMVRRAQAQVLELLPPGHAAYWEPEGELWQMKAHVNDVGNAELMDMMRAGVLRGQTPTLDQPWTTGEPLYQDAYLEGSDVAQELTPHVHAVASLPIGQGEHRRGVINFTTFQAHEWGPVERTLMETLARGLWLALERASYTHRLEEERAGLATFVDFTEVVGSERDVLTLARQAVTVLRATLPGISVAYYAHEGEHWFGRAWSEDVPPDVVEQMQAGVSATAPDFARAAQTGGAVFAESWDAPGNDLSNATMYGAAAFIPLVVAGQARSILAVGLRNTSRWSEHERSIVRAVGQGLTLALERAISTETLATRTAQLERVNQELEASNAELEAFAYSASHDLRTPVRHMQGFAELAIRALERDQPDKVRRHLGVVKEATDRMTAMIDAMLILSRVGRQVLQPQPFSLLDLVEQAQRDVFLEFPEQEIQWELGELPVVWGDAGTLQQALTNLVSNAVKFSRGQTPARIRIWAEQRPAEVAVFVQDQGVGFNMGYAEKLFGAFQRLHTQQEFSGTGVGLATVRRIVARHGGRVWAEGQVGQGATFAFTLPKSRAGVTAQEPVDQTGIRP